MTRFFREDGFESQALVVNALTSGILLSGQGATQTTYLLGANSHVNTTLRDGGSSGPVIMNIAGGNADFPCRIKVPGTTNIWSTATDAVSLFYYSE
jgi:hypothetical protein